METSAIKSANLAYIQSLIFYLFSTVILLEMINKRLIMSEQKFERSWKGSHSSCSSPDFGIELIESFVISFAKGLNPIINIIFKCLILFALELGSLGLPILPFSLFCLSRVYCCCSLRRFK